MRTSGWAILVLGCILLAGCTGGPANEPAPQAGGLVKPHLLVHAQVDGRSELKIGEGRLWWVHYDYEAPGRFSDDKPTYLNGEPWFPGWEGKNTWCGGCQSSALALEEFGRSRGDAATEAFSRAALGSATLTCVECRVDARAAFAEGVLTVSLDDNDPPGWAWYTFDLAVR